MKGIKDHALLYALIAKYCLETYGKEKGEDLICDLTNAYGEKRGSRMRANADAHNEKPDINAYLIHGEWKGKPGENESTMLFQPGSTVSLVTKCAWCDTWKQYGLLKYGQYYCRYIDRALCDGFSGDFSLKISSVLSAGDDACCFEWSGAADQETVNSRKKELRDTYILPFDFHCEEMLECAAQVLGNDGQKMSETVLGEYERLVSDTSL